MAENITLANLANLQNEVTAVNAINNNNSVITNAFVDVLSRTGVSPNTMGAPLDMNNWPVLNLPPPGTANSPARLIDVTSTNPITISLSLTGDVTAAASSGVLATTIANNAVTSAKILDNTIANTDIRQSAALTVLGNSTNATANIADIAGTTRQVLAVSTAGTSLAFSQPRGDQLLATNTNDNATAGNVGEYVQSTITSGSQIALTSGVAVNLTSISLTAGDWDVWINAYFNPAATTSVTQAQASMSTTSATMNTNPANWWIQSQAASVPVNQFSGDAGPLRFSLSGTTTIFMVVQSTFTVSTMNCYGIIQARRVR